MLSTFSANRRKSRYFQIGVNLVYRSADIDTERLCHFAILLSVRHRKTVGEMVRLGKEPT